MARIHIFLQGKGGCSKSTCANFFTQYLLDTNRTPVCYDNDPVNNSFSSFKRFHAKELNLLTKTKEVDSLRLDQLIEEFNNTPKDSVFVIDNGASVFFPFMKYMYENSVPELLKSLNHTLTFHCPVTGGPAIFDTYRGFSSIVAAFRQEARIVVWLNSFWGPVEEIINGCHVGFKDSRLYKDNAASVHGIIEIPLLQPEKLMVFNELMKNRKTFQEALAPASNDRNMLGIMPRQRIKLFRDALYGEIEKLFPVERPDD